MKTSETFKKTNKPMIVHVQFPASEGRRTGAVLGFYKASQLAPPSENFHYWTLWYEDAKTNVSKVKFFREDCIESITVEGGDSDE